MKRQVYIGVALSATLVVLGAASGLAQESQYPENWAVSRVHIASAAIVLRRGGLDH